MTHRSSWKRRERQAAAIFGTTRNALSGGNSKLTRSDSLHDHLFVETKLAARHAVWTLYDETKPKARAEEKTPVITLCRKGSPGVIICVHSDDFEKVARIFLEEKYGSLAAALSTT